MSSPSRFIFRNHTIDMRDSTLTFHYRIEFTSGAYEEYADSLHLPQVEAHALENIPANALSALQLIMGIIYWKMYCPPAIAIEGFELAPEQACFWDTVYTKGLGEFFFWNKIDFRNLVRFPSNTSVAGSPIRLPQNGRMLVPWGGGKDSAVTAELLKSANIPFDLFSFGNHHLHRETAAIIGKKLLTIVHIPDKRIAEGLGLRGHIPYTAIYAFASLAMAALYGYEWVIFSNERSADFGNTRYLGRDINHQWSKSAEFERLISGYIKRYITADIHSFSLLRPLYEIAVVERFARLPQYFDTFSSCNANFSSSDSKRTGSGAYWCGHCPKCAFVFACLAAFLPKENVIRILGINMFADERLLPLFSALLGMSAFKPFECIGTPEEMTLALYRAQKSGAYDGDPVMCFFRADTSERFVDLPALERDIFSVGDASDVPEKFRILLKS